VTNLNQDLTWEEWGRSNAQYPLEGRMGNICISWFDEPGFGSFGWFRDETML
jgi:hypothetical protein